ncbi:hypothetical protein [Rhodoplanes serenus]|uniref:hypothetical protein n=1 Tax=Rhodoplanes serenus TaxID=200615 RepID=UPI001AED105F|nr:hypothetical protein [Rhodoplanes serenus]
MRGVALAFGVAVSLGVAMSAGAVTPAAADVVIGSDRGGMIGDYVARYQRVRQSGERVVIDGTCLSACTLVLGMVPRDRVCATRNAALGFHAAWNLDAAGNQVTSPVATRLLWSLYPAHVRQWIARNGGLTHRMLMMRGRALAAVVPPCDEAPQRAIVTARRAVAAPGQARAYRRAATAITVPTMADAAMAR